MKKIEIIFLLILLSALFIIIEKSYSNIIVDFITTIAGNGTSGDDGDGGYATSARLSGPSNLTEDISGNIYIADRYNHLIRKIDSSGIITTIAGTGINSYNGDGSPATNYSLNYPSDVAVDSNGNIYIADRSNNRIRKVDISGEITTFAGTGDAGYFGDGGQAVDAELDHPAGLDIDNEGNIYIADMSNHRIRKIDISGIITTVAGNGNTVYNGDSISAISASLYKPSDIEVDSEGNIYIAEYENHRIRKVDTSGTIYTVAGTGVPGYSADGDSAVNAQLCNPWGIALDSEGNFYIGDLLNNRIRKVNPSGIINTIAGTGTGGYSGDGGDPLDADLRYPYGIIVNSNGDILFADGGNHCIRKISATITGSSPVLGFIGNQVVDEKDTLEVNISASDSDGDTIILSISNAPSFVSFVDYENGTGLLTITPDSNDIGIHEGIVITASDGYFTDTDTISITVNNVLPPDSPQNLTVFADINQVNLSWSTNNERYILQYNIYRSLYNGFSPIPSDSIGNVLSPDTSFLDTTITLNTTYYYRISAVDSFYLESDFSMQVFVTPTDLSSPDIPQNLAAEAGEKFVDLSWNSNTESDILRYTIYRSLTGGFTPTSSDLAGITIHPDTTYKDTLISPGLTYYYKISAFDSSLNESNFSDQAFAVPYDSTSPAVPQNLTAVGRYEKVNLSWDENIEPDLYLYTIYRDTTDGFFPQPSDSITAVSPPIHSFSDTGLVIGETYYYRMTASDTSNNKSGFSDQVSAIPYDTIAPAAPQNLVLAAGDGFVDLSWFLNSEADMLSYTIYRNLTVGFIPNSGDSIGSVIHPDTTFKDSSVINYTTYYYKITARDLLFNESDTSNQATATPTDTTSPSAPQNLTADAGQRQITLNWDFSPEQDVFRYVIYRSFTDGFSPTSSDSLDVTNATTSTYIDSFVSVDSTHYYKVAALDSAGNLSTFSNQAQAVPFDTVASAAPQNLTAQEGPGKITLNWTFNIEPDILRYNIYRSTTDDFIPGPSDSIEIASKSESSFIDSTGNIGTLYYYKISALDSSLNMSNFSNQASAAPLDTTPPAIPQTLTATAGNGLINLSWNSNTDADFDIYILYRSLNSGFEPSSNDSIGAFSISDTTYQNVNLINGLTYYYKLIAQDTLKNRSVPSDEASATPSPEYLWTFKTDMDSARYSLVLGEVNGKLYAIGGETPAMTPLVQEYDPATDTWTTKTSIPTARTRFASAVLNDTIYIAGGRDPADLYLNTTEFYDPASNTWGTAGLMTRARVDFTMTAVNGKIYAISGARSATQYQAMTEVFDPATKAWSNLDADITVARGEHAAAAVDDTIYVFGGDINGTLQTTTYAFNTVSNSWSTVADIPTPRTQLAALTVGGLSYVVGGNDGTNDLTKVEIYDPSDNSWTTGDTMNVARSDIGIGYVSQYGLFVAGGISSGTPLISMEMLNFPPSPPQNFNAELNSVYINLNWKPNSEIDLSHYNVYRSTTSGFTPTPSLVIAQISEPDTSYQDYGFVDGVQNYYKVIAVDDFGLPSEPSNEDSVLAPVVDLEILFGTTDQQRAPNDTFNLAINIQGSFTGKGAVSMQYKVGFDSSQIEAIDIDTANFVTPVTFEWFAKPGTLSVSLFGSDTLTGGGYSFNARFRVQPDALHDTTTLSFSDVFFNEGTPALLSISTSQVRVVPTYGDVTLDQTLTTLDASYILQYTVGKRDFVNAQMERGDVSYNGSITAYDGWLILQKIAGNISSFPIEDSLLSKIAVNGFVMSVEPVSGSENLISVKFSSKEQITNIAAFEIHLNYESAALSFLEYTFPEEMENLWTATNSEEQGVFRLSTIAQPYTELTEDFLILTFRIEDNNTNAGDFSVTHFLINETDVLEALKERFKSVPEAYNLHQNFPNPFNPETRIDFQIPKESKVTLKIYNILGQEIITLVNEEKEAGYYSIIWNGENNYGIKVSSGIYIYQIRAGDFIKSRKMVFIR